MANPEQTGPMTSRGARVRDDNDEGVGYNFAHITAAAPTTTVVKASPGFLHTLSINTPASGGVITVYNNTAGSGTVIAVYTTAADQPPTTVLYDIAFSIGLTIVTATAAQDITVSYV